MEDKWIMTSRDEFDYKALSIEDKNMIFEDLNKMVYRFDGKEKRMNKASFVHRWNPESAVAYKLMIRTHQKLMAHFRLPDEVLTPSQIASGRVYNGDRLTTLTDWQHEMTEEIAEMYDELLENKNVMELKEHEEKMQSVRQQGKEDVEALEFKISRMAQKIDYETDKRLAVQKSFDKYRFFAEKGLPPPEGF